MKADTIPCRRVCQHQRTTRFPLITLLHHVETAMASDLIHADKYAIAFSLRVFVDLGFDHAVHNLRADGALLVDGGFAVEAPADPAYLLSRIPQLEVA